MKTPAMTFPSRLVRLAGALGATALLAACAAGEGFSLPGPRAAELAPDSGLVVFAADDLNAVAARRIQYADNEHRADYALFTGDNAAGGRAEFVYMETKYNLWVSYVYQDTIADNVAQWNYTRGQAIAWDKASLVGTRVGPVFVRPFRLTAMNRACFGVSGEWDMAQQDPHLRNTRLMFGYYCARPGTDLAPRKIASLLDSIGIRGVTERASAGDRVRDFYGAVGDGKPDHSRTRRAIELAQGTNSRAGASEGAGIGLFPFDQWIEYYDPGGGDDFD